MMKKIHIYLLIALFLGTTAYAEEKSPSSYETALLQMINSARQNPLAIASSLGMDTHKIVKELPDFADIFKNGLAPLTFNSKLYQSASLHAQDILDKNYYSAVSPDKKSVQERISETGYLPIVSGESLGMLSFGNFVSPDKAAKAVFYNMFADELNPKRLEKRNILNPDLKDLGISFKAGIFTFEETPENVYLTVCDFGNNDTSVLESLLLNMINDARKNPYQAIEKFDTDNIIEKNDSLKYELPALSVNEKLCQSAENHNQDMIQRLYFDNISPDGKTPFDRVSTAGYKALYVNETLGAIGFEHFLDPKEAIRQFFIQLIENKSIFQKEASDIGINFDILFVNKEKTLKIYLITVEISFESSIFSGNGETFESSRFYIFGEKTL